eukprot:m.170741 g.170741  ORF g.170741 m.170741 type:complete len:605 (+) comp15341_c1_seq14:93-1907(+)
MAFMARRFKLIPWRSYRYYTTPEPLQVLRDYQRECIESSLSHFRNGVQRVAVSLPVGSGKTVVFSNLIPKIPPPSSIANKTLVLAHRVELLEQARDRIMQANPDLLVSMEIGHHYAQMEADVIVASVSTLGRKNSTRLARYNPEDFKCIIIDEAHHATASTYLRVLDYFKARETSHIKVWGCSATLRRHDGVSLGAIFEKVAYNLSMTDLLDKGWLCNVQAIQVDTKTSLDSVRLAFADYNLHDLGIATNTTRRNQLIVDTWMEYAKETRKSTLVFGVNVEHIEAIQSAFLASGIQCVCVDGSTDSKERQELLDKFRNREIPVLVNCGVFTEGTDIPCIDCLLLARPTKSSVLFQQMLGRGLRLYPGKENCLVLDLVDNLTNNVSISVPSLLGLVPEYDDNLHHEPKRYSSPPPEDHNRLNLHMLEMGQKGKHQVYAQEVELQQKMEKQSLSNLTTLPFVDASDPNNCIYLLELTSIGFVFVTEDFLGSYEAYLVEDKELTWKQAFALSRTRLKLLDKGKRLPMKSDTLSSALASLETYLRRHKYVKFQDTRAFNEPATAKQLQLLARFNISEDPTSPLTKYQARKILGGIFARNRNRGKKGKS